MGCMKQRHDDPHGHANSHDHRNEYMDTPPILEVNPHFSSNSCRYRMLVPYSSFVRLDAYAGHILSVHYLCKLHYSGTLYFGNVSPK